MVKWLDAGYKVIDTEIIFELKLYEYEMSDPNLPVHFRDDRNRIITTS
jgi:hypothetical protein